MFNINNFLMKTIKGMIGNYPDFQVREYAIGWWSKGKLTDTDMEEIDILIEAQYIVPEPPVEESTESETEIEYETILDDEEGTETEPEESEMESEIMEDSTNEEEVQKTEVVEEPIEE